MATLTAPPPNRHRASSTNVRPPLTLSSLGSRRRSNSLLDLGSPPAGSPAPSPVHTPSERDDIRLPPLGIPAKPPPSSKTDAVSSLVSHALRFMQLSSMHSEPASPSSPLLSRASTDDTLLPMSASPTRLAFAQPAPPKALSFLAWTKLTPPSQHVPVLFVILLFPVSTAAVLMSLYSLPISTSWPGNLEDVAQLGRELSAYSVSGTREMAHVVAVMSVLTVWNHAWSIPGSVLWNVLAGALFSPLWATLLLSLLTTVGSLLATLLAAPLAPFLQQLFPRVLELTRAALEGDSAARDATTSTTAKSPAWVRLSVLRLIGIVPWAGINITCGVCGVALLDCFMGSLIGSLPWTAVTCQVGDILQTVASTPSPTPQSVQSLLTSPEILLKLAFLTVLSLAPVLGRDHLRAWLSPAATELDQELTAARQERASRWVWIKDWRSKIRMPSRGRARGMAEELKELIQEKNDRLPL